MSSALRTRGVPLQRSAVGGFTLLELLMVLVIGVILIAFVTGGISKTVQASRATQCIANLRSLGVVAALFAADNKQRLPVPKDWESDSDKGRWWRNFTPYLNVPGGVGPVFRCPNGEAYKRNKNAITPEGWSRFDYAPVLSQDGGRYHYLYSVRAPLTPLLVEAENYDGYLGVSQGRVDELVNEQTRKRHSGPIGTKEGIHVLYCDGAVRYLPNPTKQTLRPQYFTADNKAPN